MGVPGQINHPDVQKAINSVKEACLNKNIPVSIFTTDSKGALSAKEAGYSLIGAGVDAVYLWKSAKQTLEEINSI